MSLFPELDQKKDSLFPEINQEHNPDKQHTIEEIKSRIDPSKFDTKLSPADEIKFQEWKAINAPPGEASLFPELPAEQPSVLDRIKSSIPTLDEVKRSLDPTGEMERSIRDIASGSAAAGGELLQGAKGLPGAEEGGTALREIAKKIAPQNQIGAEKFLTGQLDTPEIRQKIEETLAPTEAQILAKAQKDKAVPWMDIAKKFAAHIASQVVPTTPVQVGYVASMVAQPAAELAGTVRDFLSTKEINIPIDQQAIRDFYTFGKEKLDPQTYEQLLKIPKEDLIDALKSGQSINVKARVPRFGGQGNTEVVPNQTTTENGINPGKEIVPRATTVEQNVPQSPAPIEPIKPALTPSGIRYLADNMPNLAKVVNSIAATSHPEHLQQAIVQAVAEAEAAKIKGIDPVQAEQISIDHFVSRVRNGEIAPVKPTEPLPQEQPKKSIKLDARGIPDRRPGSVVSTVDLGDGNVTKITHAQVLDEAKALLDDSLAQRETSPLEDFVRSQGGVRGYKGGVEGEEFKGVPIHLRGPISVDEMAQMAYHRGLLDEPSGDLLREKLKEIKPRGKTPRLADFYDQAVHNLEYYAQEGVGMAHETSAPENLFQVPSENPIQRYQRLVQEGRSQGLNPIQAIKYAKEKMAQPIEQKNELRPKQTEFGAGGVEGFGRGRQGEQELFEPKNSPYQQELNLGTPETEKTITNASTLREPRAIRQSSFAVKFRKTGELVVPHQKIESPADLAFIFKGISDPSKENFYIAAIKNGEVIAVEHLGIGTVDQVAGYPFELLNLISKTGADSIVAAHNHPSGYVTPSEEDKRLTQALRKVVENNGQKFLGHVIINDTKFGYISDEGRVTELYHDQYKQTKKVDVLQKYGEWIGERSRAKELLTSPTRAYELFKGIQVGNDEGMVFLLNTQNEVNNAIVVPHGQFNVKTLQRLASDYRSLRMILINSNLNQDELRNLNSKLRGADIQILDDIVANKDPLDPRYVSRLETGAMEPGASYGSMLGKQRNTEGFQAAVKDPQTGEIYTGDSHAEIIRREIKADPETGYRISDEVLNGTDNVGFVDEQGEFITRQRAEQRYGIMNSDSLREQGQAMFEPKVGYGSDKEISQHLTDSISEIRNIVDPSRAVPLAASITREQLGKMARSFDKAEAALSDAHKYFENQSVASKIDFIDKMEKGEEQPTKQLTEIASKLRGLLDSKREEIQALGTGKLSSFIENYFPHIWDQTPGGVSKAVQIAAKRPFEGRKSFLKKRTIDFFKEGIDLGLTPVSYNPIDLTFLKIREMDKYLMAHRTLNEFKKEGLSEFVKAGGKIPEGWKKIDDRISTVMYPTEKGMVISGHIYAQPDAARIINNYLSPGLQKSSIYQAYRYAGNLINQFQLGLSAFHLGFTSVDSAVSKLALAINQLALGHPLGAMKTALHVPIAPIENMVRGDKLLKAWQGKGKSGIDEIIANAMASGGGRAKMDQFYATKAYDQMKKFFQAGKPIKGILRVPMAIMEATSKPILEWIVPRQKLGIFSDIMKMELEHNPNMTHEEMRSIAQKAWDSVDNRMGQLVYDNLFWNRTFKDLLMASVRSVGWNLGTIREVGGGIGDITKIGSGPKGRGANVSYRAAYVIALPILVGMMGAIYQYLRTGKGPQELKDLYFPRKGGLDANGDPLRDALPSYMKDIYHYTSAPIQTILNKTNPLISTLSQMLQNKDFFGVKIRNEDDPIVRQIAQEAQYILKQMIPFGIRNAQSNMESNKDLLDIGLPFIGITPAPYDVNQTKAEKLAHRIAAGKLPIGGRTQEAADRSRFLRDVSNRIKANDPTAQRDLMQAFQQGKISSDQIKSTLRNSRLTPIQRLTHSFTADELQKVYDVADESEKQQLKIMLQKKIARHNKGRVSVP